MSVLINHASELAGTKRKLFYWAHGLAEKYEINKDQGGMYNFKLGLANKIIFIAGQIRGRWLRCGGDCAWRV